MVKQLCENYAALGSERDEVELSRTKLALPPGREIWLSHHSAVTHFSGDCWDLSLTNSGVASWCDFAVFSKKPDSGFSLKVERVVPITTDIHTCSRPAYSVLALKGITVLGTYPPHWRQGLRCLRALQLYQ